MTEPHAPRVAIAGGGPAGLTAAYQLQKLSDNHRVSVYEASMAVGGIARTESYKGYRFDIGGHRFFSKVPVVNELWREVLTTDFLVRPRTSRIFYQGKYYDYPLKVTNALHNMGFVESLRIVLSYLKWQVKPFPREDNLRQWVTNRFGSRLFLHFFKSYTEKVWGMPCDEIRADWAAQRIKSLSLQKALMNAFTGRNQTTSLIESFQYPRLGPGMMWEAFRDRIVSAGGDVRMGAKVSGFRHEQGRVTAIEVSSGEPGSPEVLPVDHLISSMPLPDLVMGSSPPAPPAVQAAAAKLKYRDFLIVTLLLRKADPFPDNWIYIHSPDVQVGRIQNFRAWSPDMVPDSGASSIGMEYFCQEGDALWTMSNADLVKLATQELVTLGLAEPEDVFDGSVIRQEKAYPVYDADYRQALDTVRKWIDGFDNLQVVGRNGMHRYNNQDHSMLTAVLAVRNILGESNDLWAVNLDDDYHEEVDYTSSKAHDAA